LWPRRRSLRFRVFAATALLVALPTLFYQNTGWVQFGYRFSNDYAVFLFAMLALGGYRMNYCFRALGSWAIVVNAFGALSFGRPAYRAYYYIEPTQRVLHQPD
jgi:hypothetical protein